MHNAKLEDKINLLQGMSNSVPFEMVYFGIQSYI